MEEKMKKIFPFIVALLLSGTFSTAVKGASIEGSVQGFTCISQGKVCPVGQEDTLIATEKIFVVLTDAKKYYFVLNIDRGIMARHFNEKIKIQGDLSAGFNTIIARTIYTWVNRDWNMVWADKVQKRVTTMRPVPITDTIEGSVQGLTCVSQGKVCPIGLEDPVAASENIFVVLTGFKKYYFVPNIDRVIMARHINEKVRIEGILHANYNAIEATAIYTWGNGNWIKV
jgi:uncharacterized protein YaiI (UPF0178 family)